MKFLYNEILRRFPESAAQISDSEEDLPYLWFGDLAEWLGRLPSEKLTPEVLERVVSFTDWCLDQPRTGTAAKDILTIWTVAFVEKFFETESLRWILPRLISREDYFQNRDYWITWVGKENYELAAKYFEPETGIALPS